MQLFLLVALQAMDHVKGVQVDLESKLATVEVEAPSMIDAMNMLPNFVTTIKVSALQHRLPQHCRSISRLWVQWVHRTSNFRAGQKCRLC